MIERPSRPCAPRRALSLPFSARNNKRIGLSNASLCRGVGRKACIQYLGGGCGTLDGVLAFDTLDLLCFVIDDSLDFRLVETIHDDVFAFRDMDYKDICDIRGSFPSPRDRKKGAHRVSPKMNRAQLDELRFVRKRCGHTLLSLWNDTCPTAMSPVFFMWAASDGLGI